MSPTPRRRKRRLIKPSLQWRMIGGFVGVSALALLIQFLFVASRMAHLAVEMPAGGAQLTSLLPEFLVETLLISFLVLLPASVAIGIFITFRVAGPVYRFEQHLRSYSRGEPVSPLRIRKEDELQELCELINEALAKASGKPDPDPDQDLDAPPAALPGAREDEAHEPRGT